MQNVTAARDVSPVRALLGPALVFFVAGIGCNAILGNDEHGFAPGDAASDTPESDASAAGLVDGTTGSMGTAPRPETRRSTTIDW